MGRNRTGRRVVSATRPPTRPTAGPPARRQRYRRQTPTDTNSEQNNTCPLNGPSNNVT